MSTSGFHQSAAAFSEATSTAIPTDCDGLLARFWIPLCNMLREANMISASTQPQETQDQPHFSLDDSNMICSSSQPESSFGCNSGSQPVSISQPCMSLVDTNMICSSSQPQSSLGYRNTSPPHAVQQHASSMLDNTDFSLKSFMTVCQHATIRIHSCHFSWDGKLLAYAGTRGLVSLWNVEARSHSATTTDQLPCKNIADVRFHPKSDIFAASCCDAVIRCWEGTNASICIELRGHSNSVMSADFLPKDSLVLCSGDFDGEIRVWDVKCRQSIHKFKVEACIKHVRFQPNSNLLAVALEKKNIVMLIQIEHNLDEATHKGSLTLEGHCGDIKAICWDPTGRYLAFVSHDSAQVWTSANNNWDCGYKFDSGGYTFESCVFHSTHPQLLMIGSFMSIHIWDFVCGSKMRNFQMPTYGFISSLACSSEGFIAYASRSGEVKLWTLQL